MPCIAGKEMPFMVLGQSVPTPIYPYTYREIVAERLYRRRWSSLSWDAFLGGIPPLPRPPPMPWREFCTTLVLVDKRGIKLQAACARAGVAYEGDDDTFSVRKGLLNTPDVYWLWCQTGDRFFGAMPRDWHRIPAVDVSLTAFEGVCLHLQYPYLATRRFLDLPGSVRRIGRKTYVASLGPWVRHGAVKLHWVLETSKHHECSPLSGIRVPTVV